MMRKINHHLGIPSASEARIPIMTDPMKMGFLHPLRSDRDPTRGPINSIMAVTMDAPKDQYARYSAEDSPELVASSLKYIGNIEHANRTYAELAISYIIQDFSMLMCIPLGMVCWQ